MSDRQLWRASADLAVRDDGRTVFGLLMPFGREATVNDGAGPYVESFKRGAFAKTIAERGDKVKLLVNHQKMQRLPIGRATHLREESGGLYGEFRVSRTVEGEEALTLVNDGVVDSFSVGFQPVSERQVKSGHIERTEVKLIETSLVAFPAYEDALIAGVRSLSEDERVRLAQLLDEFPDLEDMLRVYRSSDTSDPEAVDPASDGGSEPADEATRDDQPPDPDVEHSSAPETPQSRRKAALEEVRNLRDLIIRS